MTVLDDIGAQCHDTVDLSQDCGELQASTRVRSALTALASGRAVLFCDDAKTPGRGDIVFAASAATTALTAFAVRHGSGFLHVALPADRCDELLLTPQAGAERHGLPQCVTVDAKSGAGTGISAADRAATARLLGSPAANAHSFTRPGHVVPLRAEIHRPVNHFRFCDAAAFLTGSAGMGFSATLTTVEGIEDPTSSATGRELIRFADRYRLPIVGLRDLISTSPVDIAFDQRIAVAGQSGHFRAFVEDGVEYLCLFIGDVSHSAHVDVQLVSSEALLVPPRFDGTAAIRLADARPAVTPRRSDVRRLLHDPCSGLRRLLRADGVRHIAVADPQSPY